MSELSVYLAALADGHSLSREEASRAFQIVMLGGATPGQIAALLMGLRMKGETVDEITGAALAMRARVGKIQAPPTAMDTCGTGGDNAGVLNISTAVAFVVAACGVPIAKHGNRAISSKSGSADVLVALGVNIEPGEEGVEACLRDAGICFMMAPKFHTAMRHVAPVRVELGIRTIFNLLGPLCNPAATRYHLLGVYDANWVRPLAEVLGQLGAVRAWVVHGEDGLDELTTTGISYVAEWRDGKVNTFEVTPEQVGLPRGTLNELRGGEALYNARRLLSLLEGEQSPYRDIVLLNAAASLVVAGSVPDLAAGVQRAAEVIDEGRALQTLRRLVEVSNHY